MDELDELLPLREVLRLFGVSRSTLYTWVSQGRFPPPLPNPDGRSWNRWRRSQVARYQRQMFERLDAAPKRKQSPEAAA